MSARFRDVSDIALDNAITRMEILAYRARYASSAESAGMFAGLSDREVAFRLFPGYLEAVAEKRRREEECSRIERTVMLERQE